MSLEENQEALERNTGAINDERGVRERLTRALDGLGGVVGGIVRGAPQSFAPIIDAVPGLQRFAGMMQFAEGYIDVWRSLTDRGINFGNRLDYMITEVGEAQLQMQDFMRITQDNTIAMTGMGGVVNRGTEIFLKNQQAFMELNGEFRPLRERLMMLGMTTTDIGERFAEFDRIATLQNYRSRLEGPDRNRAAAEFAENLDELARLTGKQVDQLAEEAAELAREGNVFAFSQMIDDRVRGELNSGLLNMNQLGDEISAYAKDMITRGYPDPDDPEMALIHSQAGLMREALLNARQALLDGNRGVAEEYFKIARAEGQRLQDNGTFLQLAIHRNATEMTQAATNILTAGQRAAMVQSRDIIDQEARRIFGDDYTGSADQLVRATEELIRTDRAGQLEGLPGEGADAEASRRLLQDYITTLIGAQDTAANLQGEMVRLSVAGVSTALQRITESLNGFNINETVNNALANAIGLGTSLALGTTDVASLQRIADQRVRLLTELADTLEGDQAIAVQSVADAIQNAAAAYANDPTPENQTALADAMAASARTIEANRDVFVNGQNVTIGGFDVTTFSNILDDIVRRLNLDDPDANVGTMGLYGSLFKNFGRESKINVHGVEAITTPRQMASLMENAALGALSASAQVMDRTNARNTTGMLSGMLNTLRTTSESMSQGNNPATELTSAMTNLPNQLRIPLEDAMNNTLVPKLEQLIGVNAEHLGTSGDIKRGLNNLQGDMLRSV